MNSTQTGSPAMIYLDEQIASHRKILRAGTLIGDAKGGAMAALGVFVACIGYARRHLTDGVVPDEYVQKVSRAREISCALRKAKLIKKLRGNRWLIHDYLAWNPSATEVIEKRKLNRIRQAAWHAKKACGKPVDEVSPNSVSDALLTHDPLSPIPDPQVRTAAAIQPGTSQVRGRKDTAEVPLEQRADARDFPRAQKTDTLSREPAADANVAVLVKLTHQVMAATGIHDTSSPDLVEAVKQMAARHRIQYPVRSLGRALSVAAHAQVRR
jgi:hypothetical protein